MFIKYSTFHIPPKKSRGKGSQGKKTVDDSQETIDVSKESEPEPVKKKTASRRVVKKKVTLFADDNIITDDPDVALELGKSISLTEVEEAEAARKVHATHARILIESAKKKSGGRSSRGLAIQDTPSAPKPKPDTSKPKLKGTQSSTHAKKEAADIMQALKESKKTRKRQPGTGGSSEGTSTIPGVPDESTVISATSSEGTKQESEYSEEDKLDDEEKDDKEGDVNDEGDDHISDTQDTDDEDDETESDEDEIYKYNIRVRKDEDGEMLNAEVEDSKKGDAEVSDAAKADAEKTEEAKHDSKKADIPPTSCSLSISSGFGDQFLKLSLDTSLVGTVKDTTDAEIISLLDIKIQSEVPQIQSPSVLRVPLRVAKLEKDVFELKNVDHSAATIATLKSQVPTVVDNYLGSKLALKSSKIKTPIVNLEKRSEKSASKILKMKREQPEKQQTPKFTIKSTDKATLKEYDQKSALYQTMHANKSFNRILVNHKMYHALMEALIEDENAMDKGVADRGKQTKRRRTKESKSSKKPSTTKETPKGKALSKGSKTDKSASTEEPVEEPIAEVVMDDASEDVVRDDDPPQDASEPKTGKTLNLEWFTQPPRPPTPDPEWNKLQVVLGQPKRPWFNQMVSAIKDHLTLNDLMELRLTSPSLIGIILKEIVTPLTCPNLFLCKGHPGHLTVDANYFFNNDLEYLKSSNPERTYNTSITKTKAAQYKIEGIEDMVPKLWSPTKLKKFSKHNVYSTKKIIGVKSVSVKKLHGYGHLEEIVVKRVDCQFYKFKEGDFVDLHLNDIEDMMLLTKSRHQETCRGFTAWCRELPEETQHHSTSTDLSRNRIQRTLHSISQTTRGDAKEKVATIDRKRPELMVELIDKQMREKRIIRNLERLVGARKLEMDYKLMTRTT
ncbi:hypothetical protein Tco_0975889 [Tanacetum coccineum]|uniref:Uncharacterized protein n=1 Tax=Tanacetum coccineum TaxID=301880 RepID=A0ABQ5EG07_9ASTR